MYFLQRAALLVKTVMLENTIFDVKPIGTGFPNESLEFICDKLP
jgi:hypothetical protein